MSNPGMAISGAAVVRAADAMLHTLGGGEVILLFPLLQMPNDPSVQLGLVDPGVQQVPFSPVVIRTLVTPSTGPRRRLEFLISSTAVNAALASQNIATAEALFANSLGVMFDNDLFHIEGVATEYFAGTPYLYKLTAVE
jgi:hypothetical protein